MLHPLLSTPTFSQLHCLRALLCGGERVPLPLLQRLRQSLPHLLIHHYYGPTEATINTTAWILPPEHPLDTISLGEPIPHTGLFVLDAHLRPVPHGVIGELYLSGVALARGYHLRPDLTAERFLPHPFSEQPGARLYHTGDRVRRWPDGTLEYLGRADQQLKLHGQRIEPAEIEAQLLSHPAVEQAIVLVRQPEEQEAHLVAYLLPAAGEHSPDQHSMRSWLLPRLPAVMIPQHLCWIEQVPLTSHGKIDTRALLALDLPAEETTAPQTAPRTPLEEQLHAIWSEVLRIPADQLSIFANFFELGGDSIVSIQIAARARKAGVYITPNHLFSCPTLAELASIVQPLSDSASVQSSSSQDKEAYTSTDFPLAQLNDEELNEFLSSL